MKGYLELTATAREVDSSLRRMSEILWTEHRIDDKDALLQLAGYVAKLEARLEDLETAVAILCDAVARKDNAP